MIIRLGSAIGIAILSLCVLALPQRTFASATTSSTTVLSVSTQTTTYDSDLTMKATVTGAGATPTGTVTFVDETTGSDFGEATLKAGHAEFTTASLAPGSRSLVAEYSGDSDFAESNSAPVDVAVASGPADSVAYQIDPSHDGDQTLGKLPDGSLNKLWTVTLGQPGNDGDQEAGDVSYPLIAGGLVFVTVEDSTSKGTVLYAINDKTGATVWRHTLKASLNFSGITYDGGRVFALSNDGHVWAFDAASGQKEWSVKSLKDEWAFSAPPTAYDGVVYITGAGVGGWLYALRESDGTLLWMEQVENGNTSSPAVNGSGIFLSFACQEDYRFLATGTLVWNYDQSCNGGGGSTGVLHGGDYYARGFTINNTPIILSQSAGTPSGSFASTTAPAFDNTTMYTNSGGNITAISQSGGPQRWLSTASTGSYVTAPVVSNGVVYVGDSDGTIYGLSSSTGDVVWSAMAGKTILGPDEDGDIDVMVGLGIGSNELVVPAGRRLVAFGS
ncbi:MAG: PQQ-binding-like beta-propeller repeat protein [Acidimicrobiales bacterium]